ncbi:MAG: DNA adenine methylase [Synechococcales bacterium]|nr:DNA adenine methylase [Synechococcales bacterium]
MLTQTRPVVQPRPFLKWAGGKSQLLPQYAEFFPSRYRRYFEPFLGGGAVFFHLQPDRSFLADINLELVNVYRCIRDEVGAVIDLLREHHLNHCADHYYAVRAQITTSDDWFSQGNHIERAARILYLNKTCFNGLYRENLKGHFNVPMGRYKNPSIYDPELLRACAKSLRRTQIEPYSFEVIPDLATPQDFVYFDPPYHPISATSKFTSYNRYTFLEAEQTRLRDVFVALSDRGVKVMLSNSDCEFIRELYAGYKMRTIYASRHINAKGDKRGKITELLITSY